MWDELREDIGFQLEQLEELCARTDAEIASGASSSESFAVGLAAGAALHAFYTGIENVLKRIEVLTGGPLPRGENWHTLLLEQATCDTAARPWVVTAGLKESLREYLRFRHVFRNLYPQHLERLRLEPLLGSMAAVLELLKHEIADFLRRLDAWSQPVG